MSRSIKLVLAMAIIAVVLLPVGAVALDKFFDVPDGHIFHDDITWLADNDITKGCNPPFNTLYCPNDDVSRGQMAAFLHRLAINQVVDAKTALTAEDADTLDGKDSTDFLGKTEQAADSDKLDGMDSTAFEQKGTRRLVVPGSAFFGDTETTDWSHGNYSGSVECPTACVVVAPVQLPHGATVTRVEWFYGTTGASDAQLHLEANDFEGNHDDMVIMATVACPLEPCSVEENAVSPDVINNDGRSYGLWVSGEAGHTTYAVVIVYDTTTTTTPPALVPGAVWKGDGSGTNN